MPYDYDSAPYGDPDALADLEAQGFRRYGEWAGAHRLRRFTVPAPDDPDADALGGLVGPRAASALRDAGLTTPEAARAALDADPDAFAALPGVGPATITKLSA